MFTDLSARSYIDGRRRRKSPVSVYADDRRGPTHQGAQARAATQRANSIGWGEAPHGGPQEGQTAPSMLSNKGLRPPVPLYNPEFQYSSLSEAALFWAGSCVRSAVQGRNPKAINPPEGQNAQVSANWRFLEFSLRAHIHSEHLRSQLPTYIRWLYRYYNTSAIALDYPGPQYAMLAFPKPHTNALFRFPTSSAPTA